jgi:iron complex transport system substrate-binding protein
MRCWRTVKKGSLEMLIRIFFVALFAFAWSPATHAREIVDSTQTRVVLVDRPLRIVTLAPSLAELAAEILGQGLERIVGVSEFTDYPPALAQVTSIGPYFRFNLEKIVSLKPDLVLATVDGNPKDQVDHLRELKIPVVVVSTENLAQVSLSMILVAQALGDEARGKQISAQFEKGLQRVRDRGKARPGKKVLLQVGENPLVVVGKKSFLHEALEVVGARNLYGDASAHYPKPSLEDVISRNPETILILALGKDLETFQKMKRSWLSFKKLKAVQLHQVKILQGDEILRPSLRLLEGLAILEKAIYG